MRCPLMPRSVTRRGRDLHGDVRASDRTWPPPAAFYSVRIVSVSAVRRPDGGTVLGGASKGRTDIWLILPVVICLSQRLSHACLSTNFYTVKPRMAH